MKIFKLNIDTAKPIRKVLNVPCVGEKYGIAVSATAGEYAVRSPLCQIIDGSTVIEATRKLDDGSFLFEMTSSGEEPTREVIVRVIDTDAIDTSGWDGIQIIYLLHAKSQQNVELERVVFSGPVIWWCKSNSGGGADGTEPIYYADTDKIVFKGDVEIGRIVPTKVGKRIQNIWTTFTIIPKGTYTPLELNGLFYGGKIWKAADCKVRVVLKETKDAQANEVIADTNNYVELCGVKYYPTTITVDGTEYVVLAATPNETTTEPTEEPTNEDNP